MLEIGDEIEFTNGERWACNGEYCGAHLTGIYLLPRPFPGPFDDIPDHHRIPLSAAIKPLLEDAFKGGAVLHKGAGLIVKRRRTKVGGRDA